MVVVWLDWAKVVTCGPPYILAALLHGSPAAGISQTAAWYKEWNYGTSAEGATYIRLGGHRIHVGHRPTF